MKFAYLVNIVLNVTVKNRSATITKKGITCGSQ